MRSTVDDLLPVFVAAYELPIDVPRARCALAAALKEEARLAAVPAVPSEIARRRVEVAARSIMSEVAAEYQVPGGVAGLVRPSKVPRMVEARDALCWRLLNDGALSVHKIAAVVGMTRQPVRVAVARHELRRGDRKGPVVAAPVVVAAPLKVAHG